MEEKKSCIKLVLKKKPKNVTVVEGFPGIGLVGTLATGALLDHLKMEKIGDYYFEEPPATIAIHGCEMVDPIGIYYNQKHNIVIVHAISSAAGVEFKAADLIIDLCGQLGAKQIISLEGVGSAAQRETKGFFFTKDKTAKQEMEKAGVKCLGEGIIVGVTAALLLKNFCPQLCLFAETHSKLPDSRAAAKLIEILDKYLGLKVDPKPLVKQAEEFEKKLKTLLEQTHKVKELKQQKKVRYIG